MKIAGPAISALVALFLLAPLSISIPAREKARTPTAKAMKLKVTGNIVKDESMGGYYIQGKQPPEIFRILNQNPAVLEEYAKSGKEVIMETLSVMGDNLVIETIDGIKYTEPEKN